MNALRGLCLALLWAIPAYAAPGDPRFLQGTVEWPAVLTGEPVVIVRGDNGSVYSADVAGARRQGAEVVRGGRVALLVLEGTRPHEVTAIVIGTGDVVSLSRALSQGASLHVPPAATMPASSVAVAPPAVPTPPAGTPPAPAPTASASAPPAPALMPPPAPALLPAPVPAPSPSAVAATPPPSAPTPAPAVTTPATVIVAPPTAPVPAAATTPAPTPAPPAAMPSAPPTPPAVLPSPAPGSPGKATGPSGERKQWARLDGRVMSVDGALLLLRADNGSLVMVDISQLNPNVSSALRRERLVSVYGYPLEQKFEAAGYIELDPSHPEPPRVRHR